jgi:hypothetical protein
LAGESAAFTGAMNAIVRSPTYLARIRVSLLVCEAIVE